jgi:hypothetical protein
VQAHNPPPQAARGAQAGPQQDPIEGFRQALKKALNNAQQFGWQPGQTYDVQVEFQAKVSVHNPGRIDEYIVVMH